MKILLMAPTRNRIDKLRDMLNSAVSKKHDISYLIAIDGDRVTHKALKVKYRCSFHVAKKHIGSVAIRNQAAGLMLQEHEFDAALLAVDDIEFHTGAVDVAVKELQEKFPNQIGMVSFLIKNKDRASSESHVFLMWRKTLETFPNGRYLNPSYRHFAAQELKRLGKKLKCLHESQEAKIRHWHPGTYKKLVDKTHNEGRLRRVQDKTLSMKRKASGDIWGLKDFQRRI